MNIKKDQIKCRIYIVCFSTIQLLIKDLERTVRAAAPLLVSNSLSHMKSEITSYISGHSYCATFKIENTKGEITLAPLLWNNPQMYLLYNASLLNDWGERSFAEGTL